MSPDHGRAYPADPRVGHERLEDESGQTPQSSKHLPAHRLICPAHDESAFFTPAHLTNQKGLRGAQVTKRCRFPTNPFFLGQEVSSRQAKERLAGAIEGADDPAAKKLLGSRTHDGHSCSQHPGRIIKGTICLILFALMMAAAPATASAEVAVRVSVALVPPLLPAISGRLAIGLMTRLSATIGYPAPGYSLPSVARYGLLAIGHGTTACTSGMRATGGQRLVSMAGLTTASATLAWATWADIGTTASSTTTPQ